MKETKEMYPSWCDDHGVRLENVKIKDLHDFKEHPFHVVERRQIMQWLLTDDAEVIRLFKGRLCPKFPDEIPVEVIWSQGGKTGINDFVK